MPRKPNYDFERRERERLKAEKKAKRLEAKKAAKEAKADGVDLDSSDDMPAGDDE